MRSACFATAAGFSFLQRGALQGRSASRTPSFYTASRSLHASRVVAGTHMSSPSLVSPQEGQGLKQSGDGWIHLDVRTVEEYADGHAPDSTNIPFLVRGGLTMAPNPDFVTQVATAAGSKDAKLLVSCASGKRSAMACGALEKEGYTNLKDLEGGYSAWARDESLPVERS